jgi:hypothetical protein
MLSGSETDALPPPTYSSPSPCRKCPLSWVKTQAASPSVVCVVPAPPRVMAAQSRKAFWCRMASPSVTPAIVAAAPVNEREQPSPSAPAGPAHRLKMFFQKP